MEIWLKKNESKYIQFPVLPSSWSLTGTVNNTVVTINSLGDINLLGKRGLDEISISSFFPAQAYEFCDVTPEDDPYTYVKQITKWKDNNAVLQLIITGTDINLYCTIESFEHGESDGTGDVNFTLSLKEYVYIGGRKTKETTSTTYTTKKGDTLKKIAKKKLGDSSKWKTIWKNNKKKLGNDYRKELKAGIKLVIKS